MANILLANDAELAALGEATIGAGKNHRIVAFIYSKYRDWRFTCNR